MPNCVAVDVVKQYFVLAEVQVSVSTTQVVADRMGTKSTSMQWDT